ncbi:MAG: choice-of-anchor D domain-containing protein, partial [Actinomycetota bacterium]|nr:choice-of-anchor D domain-containing protein [Actinomycetota bacterium]
VVEAVDLSGNRTAAAPASATPIALTTVDLKSNFQNGTAPVPAGHLRDFGEPFGARAGANQGSGLVYGWVVPGSSTPLNLVGNGRDRDAVADQRLDTFVHMQANTLSNAFSGVKAEGAWEISVPNGSYAVSVTVGDASFTNSVHRINIENQLALFAFKPTATKKFASATRTVNVADGRLTIDALGGTNTKIDYAEIASARAGSNPYVTRVSPGNAATNVRLDTAIAAEVSLPNAGEGIDPATINSTTVTLTRTQDGFEVPAHVNTTGGGDAIVLQPVSLLDANTQYRFDVTSGVKDFSGAPFMPWTSTFTTGTTGGSTDPSIAFDKVPLPSATGMPFASLTIGPDRKLYAGTLDGRIVRFPLEDDGTTGPPETITSLQDANGGPRMLVGLAFDPSSTASNLILWVTSSAYVFNNGPDWTGKVTRLSGPNLATVQDYVVGLPRSIRDHVTNSIAFGPDGALYFTQGANSSTGEPDDAWGNRREHLLTAALLRFDPKLVTSPPVDVKTEDGGTYDPFAAGAPVTIYASGIRNAFDLVWHSNGQLYVPTNGAATGGNTPAATSPFPASCSQRLDKSRNGPYTGPQVPSLQQIPVAEDDYLFRVVKGRYYGHPNPTRCEWVLNGGNPTSGADPAEVSQYPVGTQPDRNWGGYAYDFGAHYSPDGAIEYKGSAFEGKLDGKLLVARYSAGDDIVALTPGGTALDIVGAEVAITGLTGFADPLDLTEDVANGYIYVSELGAQRITLLRPGTPPTEPNASISPARLVFNDVQNGPPSAPQALRISNTGAGPLTVSSVTLTGTSPGQFQIVDPPSLPATVAPGSTLALSVAFNPTTTGPMGAILRIADDDPDTPQTDVKLRGLGTLGLGGANEPSLQWILDTFELPIRVGDPDPKTSALPAEPLLGDEASLQRLVKANPSNSVLLEPLAVFGAAGPSGTVAAAGSYNSGDPSSTKPLFTVPNASSQALQPTTTGPLSFDPTGDFGLYSSWGAFGNRNVYSEDALNTWEPTVGNRHKVRFYPLKDRDGSSVANAYVVAFEEATSGYDYQDLVYIIRNVKAAPPPAANARLELENMDGIPYPDRLVFSRIGSLALPPKNGVHDEVTLRIKDTGTDPLTISALPIVGPWQLVSPPSLPTTVPAGGHLDLRVRFVAESGGLATGTLTIQSNDPNNPATVVQLAGYWQSVSEGGQEPMLVQEMRAFDYTQQIAAAGEVLNEQGLVDPVGEEVLSPYWKRADTAQPVTVRQLGAYHSCCTSAPTFYWFAKGSGTFNKVLQHLPADGQSLLPRKLSTQVPPPPDPAAAAFTPTSTAFGFRVDSEWSDPTKNDATTDIAKGCPGPCGHHMRFWPAHDRSGRLVRNSWLMTMDYAGINYDYQDNTYLISNVKPENASVDPGTPGPAPGEPSLVRNFDLATTATLADKDGEGTGFPMTQPNKLDIATGSSSYKASALDLLTTGAGTLTVTSAPGSNAATDNTLVNGLQLPFDGTTGKYSAGGRILGPLTAIDAGAEQAGVMFGPDQDNYVKLVAINQSGAPAIQFFAEQNAAGSVVGSSVALANPQSLTSLELQLLIDPGTATIRAAYRANYASTSTGWVVLPNTVQITRSGVGRFFDPQSKGGVLVTSKGSATPISITFDSFGIVAGDPTAPAATQVAHGAETSTRRVVETSSALRPVEGDLGKASLAGRASDGHIHLASDDVRSADAPLDSVLRPARDPAPAPVFDLVCTSPCRAMTTEYPGAAARTPSGRRGGSDLARPPPPTHHLGATAPTVRRRTSPTVLASQAVSADVVHELAVSRSPDRASPVPLSGATVSNAIYVFVRPEIGITRVRFYLDDPELSGSPRQIEALAPYDFAGTAADGTAKRLDTSAILDGSHTITAAVELKAGGTETVHSSFTVKHAPAPPRVLTATASSAGISLDWSDNEEPDLAGYNVYRSTSRTGTYARLNANPLETSGYLDSAAPTATTSWYRVTAVDTLGSESQPATIAATRGSTHSILLSSRPDRSSPVALAGTTASNAIYVFVQPQSGVSRVRFYLDDPEQSGSPRQTEALAPYDFGGTAADGTAKPFDTESVADGPHTITAAVDLSAGGTDVLNATFNVDNQFVSTYTWSTASAAPIGRTEALAAQVDGKLYVFGGYTSFSPLQVTARVDVYDPTTDTWSQRAPLPAPVTHAGTTVDRHAVFLAGGYAGNAAGTSQTFATKAVWKYDIDSNSWSALPDLPQARGSGALVRIGRTLHFFSGADALRVEKPDHWTLSLDGGTGWSPAAPFPNPSTHMGAVTLGGKIYAIGGDHGVNAAAVSQSTVYVWDPARPKDWTRAADLPRRRSHASSATFVLDGRIVVIGGLVDHATTFADVTAYQPESDSWMQMTTLPAP